MRTLGSRLSLLAAVFLLGAMSGFVLAESGAVARWRGAALPDAPAATATTAAAPDSIVGSVVDSVVAAVGPVPATDAGAGPPGHAASGASAAGDDGGATPSATAPELDALRRALAVPVAGVARADLRPSFDERRGGGTRAHEALDIPAPRGTPVVSAADGRVLKLFTSDDGGLMVYAADATERFVLIYAHLDAYAPGLREGAALRRGERIGAVGTTGNAPADVPHLHFAIARAATPSRRSGRARIDWWRGTPVDPHPLLAP